MFCKFCGKQTENTNAICDQCKAEFQAAMNQNAAPSPQPAAPATPVVDADPTPQEAPASQETPASQEAPVYASPAYTPAASAASEAPANKMFGFGKALTSTILGFVGFISSILSVSFAGDIRSYSYSYRYYYYSYSSYNEENLILSILMMLLSIGMAIPAMITGISSIKNFKNAPAGSKPVATLILGISGLTCAAFALIFAMIASIVIIDAI